jgi:hypothetical protein
MALTVILVATIILSALVYVVVTPKQGDKFTEFYILGPNGKAYDYPTSVASGQNSTVIVGIVNHEYVTVNCTMRMAIQNSKLSSRYLRLDHNQTWESPVVYKLHRVGDNQKLEFLLYKEYNFTAPTGTSTSGLMYPQGMRSEATSQSGTTYLERINSAIVFNFSASDCHSFLPFSFLRFCIASLNSIRSS